MERDNILDFVSFLNRLAKAARTADQQNITMEQMAEKWNRYVREREAIRWNIFRDIQNRYSTIEWPPYKENICLNFNWSEVTRINPDNIVFTLIKCEAAKRRLEIEIKGFHTQTFYYHEVVELCMHHNLPAFQPFDLSLRGYQDRYFIVRLLQEKGMFPCFLQEAV